MNCRKSKETDVTDCCDWIAVKAAKVRRKHVDSERKRREKHAKLKFQRNRKGKPAAQTAKLMGISVRTVQRLNAIRRAQSTAGLIQRRLYSHVETAGFRGTVQALADLCEAGLLRAGTAEKILKEHAASKRGRDSYKDDPYNAVKLINLANNEIATAWPDYLLISYGDKTGYSLNLRTPNTEPNTESKKARRRFRDQVARLEKRQEEEEKRQRVRKRS